MGIFTRLDHLFAYSYDNLDMATARERRLIWNDSYPESTTSLKYTLSKIANMAQLERNKLLKKEF